MSENNYNLDTNWRNMISIIISTPFSKLNFLQKLNRYNFQLININSNFLSTLKPTDLFELLNTIQTFLNEINITNFTNTSTIQSTAYTPNTQITIQT
jgi:hypothetical protein